MKNKYDTSVIFLYAIGNEGLLPKDFRKQIPYSTISTWRKTDYSKYLGHEFRYFFDEAFKAAELIKDLAKMKAAMRAFARSWISLAPTLHPIIKNARKDRVLQQKIVDAIGYMQTHIGLEKSLKLIGLSRTLYQEWILELKYDCFDSFSSLCVKRHPHQLGLKEVKTIKAMLTDPEFNHWPIVSIAGIGLRSKRIVASLYSWYKYARLFDIYKKPVKKDRKTIGIVSKFPNEYLHVDTTYYQINDSTKVCITFVMDNFSKMILGFNVAEHLSFDVVKKALAEALTVIAQHPDQNPSFLVADGGRENHNKQIDKFITELSGRKITKIRALKDIRFSNSPVEAVHRTLKSRYLRNRKFDSIESLEMYLKWAVRDYNVLRPHYKHRPRTPHEVYFNQPLNFNIEDRVKDAIKLRIETNKCSNCTQCKGERKEKCKL